MSNVLVAGFEKPIGCAMDNYNFWRDLFDTYQSLNDWIKALWLVVPPAFILGLTALLVRLRTAPRKGRKADQCEVIWTIHESVDGELSLISAPKQNGKVPRLLRNRSQ